MNKQLSKMDAQLTPISLYWLEKDREKQYEHLQILLQKPIFNQKKSVSKSETEARR